MTEPPPRKRFQIHLSTAIVMMFVAGALLWANLNKGIMYNPGLAEVSEVNLSWTYADVRGWPYIMRYDIRGVADKQVEPPWIIYKNVIKNSAIALSILFAVWFLCEWLIRRRAARKGA